MKNGRPANVSWPPPAPQTPHCRQCLNVENAGAEPLAPPENAAFESGGEDESAASENAVAAAPPSAAPHFASRCQIDTWRWTSLIPSTSSKKTLKNAA